MLSDAHVASETVEESSKKDSKTNATKVSAIPINTNYVKKKLMNVTNSQDQDQDQIDPLLKVRQITTPDMCDSCCYRSKVSQNAKLCKENASNKKNEVIVDENIVNGKDQMDLVLKSEINPKEIEIKREKSQEDNKSKAETKVKHSNDLAICAQFGHKRPLTSRIPALDLFVKNDQNQIHLANPLMGSKLSFLKADESITTDKILDSTDFVKNYSTVNSNSISSDIKDSAFNKVCNSKIEANSTENMKLNKEKPSLSQEKVEIEIIGALESSDMQNLQVVNLVQKSSREDLYRTAESTKHTTSKLTGTDSVQEEEQINLMRNPDESDITILQTNTELQSVENVESVKSSNFSVTQNLNEDSKTINASLGDSDSDQACFLISIFLKRGFYGITKMIILIFKSKNTLSFIACYRSHR
ncbi:unnamed protein product [Thelazia callipaeda]|uniref:Pecanex-like protein n=1 Tax=Thelazia callipaeda TaxID=103827 RepID=A0A0N5DAI6_THECL|nr:unnamed protein product [Thelazia callipaeda]